MAARIFMSGASASSAARRTGGERRPRSRPRAPPPRGAYRQPGDRQRVEGRRRQGLWVVRRPGRLPKEDRRRYGGSQVRAGEDGGGGVNGRSAPNYMAPDLHRILAREEREHSRVVGRHETRERTPGIRLHPLGNCTRWIDSSGTKSAGWVRSLGSSVGGRTA